MLSGTVVDKVVAELESCGFQCFIAGIGGGGVEINFGVSSWFSFTIIFPRTNINNRSIRSSNNQHKNICFPFYILCINLLVFLFYFFSFLFLLIKYNLFYLFLFWPLTLLGSVCWKIIIIASVCHLSFCRIHHLCCLYQVAFIWLCCFWLWVMLRDFVSY